MLESMKLWNSDNSARHSLDIGIGIHAGPVALGRIAATRDSPMSVFGDTVNVASRLEQMTRAYSTDLIVSDELAKTVAAYAPSEVGPERFSTINKGKHSRARWFACDLYRCVIFRQRPSSLPLCGKCGVWNLPHWCIVRPVLTHRRAKGANADDKSGSGR